MGSADEQHLLLEKAPWTEEVKVNSESKRQQALALYGAVPARRGRQAATDGPDGEVLTLPSDLPRGQDSRPGGGAGPAALLPVAPLVASPEQIIDPYWPISALTHLPKKFFQFI